MPYPQPMPPDFASLPLSQSLLAVVGELGFEQPTPVQVEAIPLLLAGKDLIGQSRSGSGKTAAFALPILQNLELETRCLQALIVCPTRELAAQVARELRKFGRKHKDLAVLELVGGQRVEPQTTALAKGVHVAVGTPGRLLDHMKRGTLDCSALATVVLDEADRMLDMGFGAEVEAILLQLPGSRQTALFSATYPSTIEAMSHAHQRDPVRVTIDKPEQEAPALRQFFLETEPAEKLDALYWLLDHFPHESALIFCNFKATVAELAGALSTLGFSVDRLDGDLEQFQRDQVLARFRNQSVRLLIATDVAGRGIDVEDLELVVNYELPAKPDIYVHRIGRTGRAGKSGTSVSLASSRELSKIKAIELATGDLVERVQREAGSEPDIQRLVREAAMLTILISGGRKDKVRPGDILGALTGDAGGISGDDIGKIEIQDRRSYVAVAKRVARGAVKSINSGRIKGKRFRASLIS
jgi:ATP-independent RNA helicase DbpA